MAHSNGIVARVFVYWVKKLVITAMPCDWKWRWWNGLARPNARPTDWPASLPPWSTWLIKRTHPVRRVFLISTSSTELSSFQCVVVRRIINASCMFIQCTALLLYDTMSRSCLPTQCLQSPPPPIRGGWFANKWTFGHWFIHPSVRPPVPEDYWRQTSGWHW